MNVAALAELAMRLSVMALLLGAGEGLLPTGGMKRTAALGAGLAFVSYPVKEIVGILGRLGV